MTSPISFYLKSALFLLTAVSAQAASFNISGNYRFGSQLGSNFDLASGTPAGFGQTSTFLEQRFLLRPDVLIDDRFTVRSEWNVLQMSSQSGVPANFGSTLDGRLSSNTGSQSLLVRRLHLEWASDWGIFRFGRMPKSWGLGVLFDPGLGVYDDFGTTVDRAAFQAMLGNLGVQLAFEKGAEGKLGNDADDRESFELSMEYANAESEFDVGILYTRNVRMSGSAFPGRSSNDFSLYGRKRWENFRAAGEFASIGPKDLSNSVGVLAQVGFKKGSFDVGVDAAVATASDDASFVFNPNYQPFLILFRQSLGNLVSSSETRGGFAGRGVGSDVTGGGASGAVMVKGRFAYTFESGQYTLATDLGFAQLARSGSSDSKSLGTEVDLHLNQKWYDNFSMNYALGFLVPGEAFNNSPQTAWAVAIRGALTF